MFVFPMAGSSQRFRDVGFAQPKYMLEARGRSLFHYAVGGFHRYFEIQPFLFVIRADLQTRAFVEREIVQLGLRDARIVELDGPTSGQAETVALGLRGARDNWSGPFGIFNIDTFRRDFVLPSFAAAPGPGYGGYLEVFRGEGEHWSFVRPGLDGARALEVREKMRISDLCSTGFYHFASPELFFRAYAAPRSAATEAERRESYVAPLYNFLISEGLDVCYNVIGQEDVIFCGVPAEYQAFLSSDWTNTLP